MSSVFKAAPFPCRGVRRQLPSCPLAPLCPLTRPAPQVGAKRAGGLTFNSWVMHDWVRVDSALLRIHHYRLRSRDWMLKVPPPPRPFSCKIYFFLFAFLLFFSFNSLNFPLAKCPRFSTDVPNTNRSFVACSPFPPPSLPPPPPPVGPDKVKACRGFALTGGSGNPSDALPLLETLTSEDRHSSVSPPPCCPSHLGGQALVGKHPPLLPFSPRRTGTRR